MDGMGKNTKKVMQMAWTDNIQKSTIKATKDGKKVNAQREPGTTGDFQTALNRLCQALNRADSVGITFTKNEKAYIVDAINAMGELLVLMKSPKSEIRMNQGVEHIKKALRNAEAWRDKLSPPKPKQP